MRRIVDITVAVILAALGLALAFGIFVQFSAFLDPTGDLVRSCAGSSAAGTRCSPSFLQTLCYLGYAICLLGWGVPFGFMVARIIQNRLAWYWPAIGIVVVYLGYFALVAGIGAGYLPTRGAGS